MSLYGLTGGSAGESESGVGFHFGVGGELVALVDLGQFLFCIWRSPPYPPYIFFFQQAVGQLSVWQGGSWVSLMVDRTG